MKIALQELRSNQVRVAIQALTNANTCWHKNGEIDLH
jgi:hypothetical protein